MGFAEGTVCSQCEEEVTLHKQVDKIETTTHSDIIYWRVQSVREVQRSDSKRFMFEIIMKNGKRKMLTDRTVSLLFSVDMCEQQESRDSRTDSSTPIGPHRERVMDLLPALPLSAPSPSDHQESWCIPSPIPPFQEPISEDEPMYQNVILHCGNQQNGEICGSVEMEEGVYDFPLSYRMGDTHPVHLYNKALRYFLICFYKTMHWQPLMMKRNRIRKKSAGQYEFYVEETVDGFKGSSTH
ncbi:hypothetical protein EXN66_Car015956 [Channa argus]|uniref:Uncharacterized protein n=1 Tax=Channa argus TaxID=215402 RepID=A0A6G1QCY8_CHAAH|nr:hypothetical protein EXN66_Car015956 [Channa argus]